MRIEAFRKVPPSRHGRGAPAKLARPEVSQGFIYIPVAHLKVRSQLTFEISWIFWIFQTS